MTIIEKHRNFAEAMAIYRLAKDFMYEDETSKDKFFETLADYAMTNSKMDIRIIASIQDPMSDIDMPNELIYILCYSNGKRSRTFTFRMPSVDEFMETFEELTEPIDEDYTERFIKIAKQHSMLF